MKAFNHIFKGCGWVFCLKYTLFFFKGCGRPPTTGVGPPLGPTCVFFTHF
ncbi:hypothetical protein HanIR_Chr05g0248901 [Helianthus annuus]|nr:hypothetical protein HanIR_Chr05g0248901 [Helianthus annuus]